MPLLSPEFAFEFGTPPYTCNVPNVIFLEAARALGNDTFEVKEGRKEGKKEGKTIVLLEGWLGWPCVTVSYIYDKLQPHIFGVYAHS